MKLNLQTDTATLIKEKVLSGKARNACLALNLKNVREIVSIPVRSVEQMCRLTKQPLVELCRLHEAFAHHPDSVESADIVAANRQVKASEYTRLYKGFADHVLSHADSQNRENDSTIAAIAGELQEKWSDAAVSILSEMYGDDIYKLAADISGRKARILNMEQKDALRNVTVRNLAADILNRFSLRDNLSEREHDYFFSAAEKMRKYGAYRNAGDLYACMDSVAKEILRKKLSELADTLPQKLVARYRREVKSVSFSLDGIYHPHPDYHFCEFTRKEEKIYLQFLDDFKKIFEAETDYYYKNSAYKQDLSRNADRVITRYPWITVEDCALFDIDGEGNGIPDLFLYLRRLQRENEQHTIVRREAAGLNGTGTERTFEEISRIVHLSPETVRKVNFLPFTYRRFTREFRDRLTSALADAIANRLVVPDYDPVWQRIIADHKLDITVRQLMMVFKTVFRGSDVYRSGNGHDYFFRCFEAHRYPLKTAERTFLTKISKSVKDETTLDMHAVFGNHREDRVESLSLILEDYIRDNPRVEMTAPLCFRLLPDCIDKEDGVASVLDEAGEPLTADDILLRLTEKYPEDRSLTISAVKTALKRSGKVSAKGTTGYYILNSWPGHFTGSITDYLYQILNESDSALTIEQLTEQAQLMFPTTSRRSVVALLNREVPRRFVRLKDKRYKANKKYCRQPASATDSE